MPLSTYQRGATPTAIILWQGATHRVQPGDQLQRWHVASIDAQGVLLTQSSAATKPAPVPARPVRVSTDPAPDWIAVIGRRLGIPASILAAVELQLTRSPGGRMGLQLPASEWLVAGPNQAFEPGDIVLSVNGIGLNRPQDLSGELERVDGSKPLRIEIARNGRLLMVEWFWLES